jgi:D-sedoheptulose 7-phosphate isomerase
MLDPEKTVIEQLEHSIELKKFLQEEARLLVTISGVLSRSFLEGHKVIIFGNGGSAADAQHIAAELTGKFYFDRKPLPAIALTGNTSSLTAIANDFGYDQVFSRQVESLVNEGDVVIGISTSGNSTNVLLALAEGKRRGAVTVAFTGQGGKIHQYADYILAVPSKDTPRIQEAHITAGHLICYLVEEFLFGSSQKSTVIYRIHNKIAP